MQLVIIVLIIHTTWDRENQSQFINRNKQLNKICRQPGIKSIMII